MVEHTLYIMYFHFGQLSASSSHSLYHLQAVATANTLLFRRKKTCVRTSTDLLRHFDSLSFSLTHLQSLSHWSTYLPAYSVSISNTSTHIYSLSLSLTHTVSLSHPPIHSHSVSTSLTHTHTHTLTLIQSLTHPSIHIQVSISLTRMQTNMFLLPTTTTPKHSEMCEVSFLTETQFTQTQRWKVIRPELQPPHGPLAATPDWSVLTTPSATWHPTGVMLCSPQTRACLQRLTADPQCHQQEEKSLSAHCCGHRCLHRCCHQGLEHQIQPSHCHRQRYQGWGAAMAFLGSTAVLHLFRHFWGNLLLELLWLSVSLISKRKNRETKTHYLVLKHN